MVPCSRDHVEFRQLRKSNLDPHDMEANDRYSVYGNRRLVGWMYLGRAAAWQADLQGQRVRIYQTIGRVFVLTVFKLRRSAQPDLALPRYTI